MNRVATPILLAAVLAITFLSGDPMTLGFIGLVAGSLIAFVALKRDKELRGFDRNVRWIILREWAFGSFLISLIFGAFAYWRENSDFAAAAAGTLLGVGLAHLLFEMLARKRAIA